MIHMPEVFSSNTELSPCRIGVARDDAFSFYYRDNLKLLTDSGTVLCFILPVHDDHLPQGLDAIYVGGGYPAAQELHQNESMRKDIRSFAEAGGI
jgi:cobyrinic acid a,c-diamide synthase